MNGRIVDGAGDAGRFVASVSDRLEGVVGFRPYPGTLNLAGVSSIDALHSERHPMPGDNHCDGLILRPCRMSGARAAVLRPLMPGYPDEKTELIAPVKLRELFAVTDNDEVQLSAADDCSQTAPIDGRALDKFDAVVFDLDGTVVDLQVEWSDVHAELEELLEPHLDSPLTSYSRADVFSIAREYDRYDELDEIISVAEIDGARSARARNTLDLLERLDCPIGICTANAKRAATIALEKFGVLRHVDALIARNTIRQDKPHHRTLRACLEPLDVKPGNAIYVGDERTDEELAVNAEASFAWVDSLSL